MGRRLRVGGGIRRLDCGSIRGVPDMVMGFLDRRNRYIKVFHFVFTFGLWLWANEIILDNHRVY
jgi:hypothetical protein